ESISRELYISERYLSRSFTRETGLTLSEYITEKRIDYAKELLTGTTLSITDISLKVGYNFAAYFAKIFKEKTGMTPNQWRETKGTPFHSSSALNSGSQNCICAPPSGAFENRIQA
ncbi:MAG: helix-turn-helix transcriptional regulator, partial [Lachnospiraceae bacterium]|nr:helix-turn-helix transcriptional regulator [Lachnospiraceae bacterium]